MNGIEKINKKSKEISYQPIFLTCPPTCPPLLTDIILVDPDNYIDYNFCHPSIGTQIFGKDVVYKKEDLVNGKWLFCIRDEKIINAAKKQIRKLIRSNVLLVIQNKCIDEHIEMPSKTINTTLVFR